MLFDRADVGVLGFDPLAFQRQVFGRGRDPLRWSRRCGRRLCRRSGSRRSPAPGSAAPAWSAPAALASSTRASVPSAETELTPAMPATAATRTTRRDSGDGPALAARGSAAASAPARARRQRRPSAPWRIGSSRYFQESAETAKIATSCSSSRSGSAPVGDAARGGEDDDREVPEVDAVGAHADPAQRLPAEHRAEPAGRVGQRRPAPAPSRSRAGRSRRGRGTRSTGRSARSSARSPARPATPSPSSVLRAPVPIRAAQLAARPDHRQGGAEEQLRGARVGAVVDPRGVEARAGRGPPSGSPRRSPGRGWRSPAAAAPRRAAASRAPA